MALRGNLDAASCEAARGWAFEPERPDMPVSVVVRANGEVVARGLADLFRPDLPPHLGTDGRHSFDFRFKRPLQPGIDFLVEAIREDDGAILGRKTVRFLAAFDARTRSEWRASLSAAQTQAEYQDRLDFLISETERLRVAFARQAGGLEDKERNLQSRRAGLSETGVAERPRALVIDSWMPTAQRDAGSNAILSHTRALLSLGYDVHFVPATLTGDSRALEALGARVYKAPLVTSVESLLQRQRGAYALIYLHRMEMASRYMALARAHQPKAKIVYSVADLHHLRLARQSAVERRPELIEQARRIRRQELASAEAADAVITHSRVEADLLRRHAPRSRPFVALWSVEPRPVATPLERRCGLAFVAGFGHTPNVDAAHFLVQRVMPEVWKVEPDIKCLLVGSQMPPQINALAGDRVETIGFVTDLSLVFERVRLSVAPLAFGAGVKGKVLDSLAAGVPCVCTPIAAEGLDLPPPAAKLVAIQPAELVQLIVLMHRDFERNREAAQAGLGFIATYASPETTQRALDDVLKAIQAPRPASERVPQALT